MYRQSENLVKQQYLLHISPQYGELGSLLRSVSEFGHPSRFQLVLYLGFISAATLLNRGHQNFAGCLTISWAGTLYIHFGGSYPLTEFCQLQNSYCVQVLHSPILVVLLHGTREEDICIAFFNVCDLVLRWAHVNEGSHSFTSHAIIHMWNEPSCLCSPAQSITSLWPVLLSRPGKSRRLSWPGY